MGLWRAGELGEHADIHPIEVIFGSSDRAISAVDWLILLGHMYIKRNEYTQVSESAASRAAAFTP